MVDAAPRQEVNDLGQANGTNKQHGLPELTDTVKFEESRIAVDLPVGVRDIAEHESAQACARGSVPTVDIPRHQVARLATARLPRTDPFHD